MNLKEWHTAFQQGKKILHLLKRQPLHRSLAGVVIVFITIIVINKIFFKPADPLVKPLIPAVQVVSSHAQPFTPSLILTAETKANRKITLRAEISGKITEILEEKGKLVQCQQPLLRMADKDKTAGLAQAQARFEHREAEYNAAKKLNTKEFIAENNLLQAKANLENAKAELAKMAYDVDQLTVKSPFTGYYEERFIETGDYVNIGDKLVTIVDLSTLKLVAYVSENEISCIKLHQTAKVTIGQCQDAFEAKVTYVSRVADPKTRTFVMELAMDNQQANLSEGLTGKIELHKDIDKAHKINPAILTLDDQGVIGVMLVQSDNKASFCPIEILQAHGEEVFVKGLPEHATLVTVGAEFIKNGQEIIPVPSQASHPL